MKATDLLPPEQQPSLPAQEPPDGALTVLKAGEGPDVSTLTTATASTALAVFDSYRAELEKLKVTAEKLTVTSVDQTLEIRMAGEARLALKKLRCEVERKRKELGADALERKRKIDAVGNGLIALIEPLERRMQDQEDFVAREEARLAEIRRVERTAALEGLGVENIHLLSLGSMDDGQWKMLLDGATAAKKKREDEAAENERREARKIKVAPLHPFMRAIHEETDLGKLSDEKFEEFLNELLTEKARKEEEDRKAEEARHTLRVEREALLKPLAGWFIRSPGFDVADMEEGNFQAVIAELAAKKKRKEDEDAVAAKAQKAATDAQEALRKQQKAEQAKTSLRRIRGEKLVEFSSVLHDVPPGPDLAELTEEQWSGFCIKLVQAKDDADKKAAAAKKQQDAAQKVLDDQKKAAQDELDRQAEEARKLANAGDAEKLLHWRDAIQSTPPPKLKNTALSAKIADEHRAFVARIETAASALKGKKQTQRLL